MRHFMLLSHSMRQLGGSYDLMSAITTDDRRHKDTLSPIDTIIESDI